MNFKAAVLILSSLLSSDAFSIHHASQSGFSLKLAASSSSGDLKLESKEVETRTKMLAERLAMEAKSRTKDAQIEAQAAVISENFQEENSSQEAEAKAVAVREEMLIYRLASEEKLRNEKAAILVEAKAVEVREEMMALRLEHEKTLRDIEEKAQEAKTAAIAEAKAVNTRESMMVYRLANEKEVLAKEEKAREAKIAALIEAKAVKTRENMLSYRIDLEKRLAKKAATKAAEKKRYDFLQRMMAERLAAEKVLAKKAAEKKYVTLREKMLATRLEMQGEIAAAMILRREKKAVQVAAYKEARTQPKSPEVEKKYAEKYEVLSETERNFAILVDLGLVKESPNPDCPEYDDSEDDLFCDDYEE